MAATLYLVRHAVTASTGIRLAGHTQSPLSEEGRLQALATAEFLAGVPLKAVYASPLARTTETAEIVAAPHRLPVRPASGVIEVDYGRWTDRPLKPLFRTRLWPVIQRTPSLVVFPDGESIRGVQARAVDAVEEIADRHDGKAVAVVSHGDVIKALVAFYVGMPLDMFQRLVVSPASVSVLSTGKGARPALLGFNHVPVAASSAGQ